MLRALGVALGVVRFEERGEEAVGAVAIRISVKLAVAVEERVGIDAKRKMWRDCAESVAAWDAQRF